MRTALIKIFKVFTRDKAVDKMHHRGANETTGIFTESLNMTSERNRDVLVIRLMVNDAAQHKNNTILSSYQINS